MDEPKATYRKIRYPHNIGAVRKLINKHRSQSRTNDMLQNNRVGGWEDLSRKSSAGLLRVEIKRSAKEAQNTPAEPGPGRDSRHGSGCFASVYVFRTQVHSLICCQFLLLTNNIDNEPPFVRRRDI